MTITPFKEYIAQRRAALQAALAEITAEILALNDRRLPIDEELAGLTAVEATFASAKPALAHTAEPYAGAIELQLPTIRKPTPLSTAGFKPPALSSLKPGTLIGEIFLSIRRAGPDGLSLRQVANMVGEKLGRVFDKLSSLTGGMNYLRRSGYVVRGEDDRYRLTSVAALELTKPKNHHTPNGVKQRDAIFKALAENPRGMGLQEIIKRASEFYGKEIPANGASARLCQLKQGGYVRDNLGSWYPTVEQLPADV